MKGNFHVRFLGEGVAVMPLPYPTTKVGRHRRINYPDLLAYRAQADESARRAMDDLSRQAQELGMGY